MYINIINKNILKIVYRTATVTKLQKTESWASFIFSPSLSPQPYPVSNPVYHRVLYLSCKYFSVPSSSLHHLSRTPSLT